MHEVAELALEGNAPTALDTAAKRAAIEAELRTDAGRSDREIGRAVGVDHKTVSARRRAMGIADPLGNLSPTEQTVDTAIAKPVKDESDDHWNKDNPGVLLWDQPATVTYYNQIDQVVIKQQADWNEESDPYIRFAPENLPRLIQRLQEIHSEWERRQ